jgi:hypothetical protein
MSRACTRIALFRNSHVALHNLIASIDCFCNNFVRSQDRPNANKLLKNKAIIRLSDILYLKNKNRKRKKKKKKKTGAGEFYNKNRGRLSEIWDNSGVCKEAIEFRSYGKSKASKLGVESLAKNRAVPKAARESQWKCSKGDMHCVAFIVARPLLLPV